MTSHDFVIETMSHLVAFTESGCKGTTKNAYVQEKREIYKKIIDF